MRFYTILFLYIFLLLSPVSVVFSQVAGCKDPAASNYNAAATVNDGSCLYATTNYTPPVKVSPMHPTLMENSGLQMAGNFLWTLNDGNNAAAIYRIDTVTNAILQTINLDGAANVDWEDIAFDGTHFYIGDFGNNLDGARTDLTIYKFPFTAIPTDYLTSSTVTVPASEIEIIRFSYSDQVPVTATAPNSTKFDCEAMFVDNGRIHLFTKNWVDVNTTHYVINGTAAGNYVATPTETLATNYLVTAADKAPGANVVMLLGYQNSGAGSHFLHILSDYNNGFFFNGNKRLINLPSALTMGQAEGLTFLNDTYGYISNENFTQTVFGTTITVDPKLRFFNTSAFTPMSVLPINLVEFNARKIDSKHRINWQFNEAVNELKILQRQGQNSFTEVDHFMTSEKGSMTISAPASATCYQLSWQNAVGTPKLSPTVCLAASNKNGFQQWLLQSGGRVSFTYSGTKSERFTFKVFGTDGRMMTQTTKTVHPGANSFQFSVRLVSQGLVLVEATGANEQYRALLPVNW